MAITLLLGAAYVRVAPKQYVATASILIDAPASLAAHESDLLAAQARLIVSKPVLERVVEAEHFDQDTDSNGKRGGIIAMLVKFAKPKAGEAKPDVIALAALEHAIKIIPHPTIYGLDVQASASDPQKSARIANGVVRAYIANQRAARDEMAQTQSEALTRRLQSLQSQLKQAELAYQAFLQARPNQDDDNFAAGDKNIGGHDDPAALARAQAKTDTAKARYRQARDILQSHRPTEAQLATIKSPRLDRLRLQYDDLLAKEANYATTLGNMNPTLLAARRTLRLIKASIVQELQRLRANAASDYRQALARQKAISSPISAVKNTTKLSPALTAESDNLQASVAAKRMAYEAFLRASDAGLEDANMKSAGLGQIARVTKLALAPTFATTPPAPLIMAQAGLLGLLLSLPFLLFKTHAKNNAAPIGRAGKLARDSTKLGDRREFGDDRFFASPPAMGMDAFYADLLDDCELEPWELVGCKIPLTILVAELACDRQKGAHSTQTGIALAIAAAKTRARVLVLQADPEISDLYDQLDCQSGQLIQMGDVARPCYGLHNNAKIQIVPMDADEAGLVHDLQRQRDIKFVQGIAGNFDVVIWLGGQIGENPHSAELAQTAARVVLEVEGDFPRVAEISKALYQLGVSPEKLGGLWTIDSSQVLAA